MKRVTRRYGWSFIGIVATLALGCNGRQGSPSAPSVTRPSGGGSPSRSYTISGVIAEYRGGPISGVNVGVRPNLIAPGLDFTWTQTDEQGHYSLSGLSGPVMIEIWKGGYTTARKYHLRPEEQTVNFVMHPGFEAEAGGKALSGTIWGDEFVTGDDDLDGFCANTACKVIGLGGDAPVEIRLRWSDPANQLALYLPRGEVYIPIGLVGTVDRLCCSSELVGTYTFNGDFGDFLAVGFEQAAGGRPGPTDSQRFELTVQPTR
jgi:hypothetical protein